MISESDDRQNHIIFSIPRTDLSLLILYLLYELLLIRNPDNIMQLGGNQMNKAFTKEDDNNEDEKPDIPVISNKNYVTPTGLALLQNEHHALLKERLKVVDIVRWAAGNGDRSENGDYIYNKRRLREIDRRVRYLIKRIDTAQVVDTALQKNLTKVFFGATVTYTQENGDQLTIKIVGIDEADLKQGKISWISPVAKALMKAEEGDVVTLKSPRGSEKLKIIRIEYIAS